MWVMEGITASDRHEKRLLEHVEDACAAVRRLEAELQRARVVRDQAIVRALRAGIRANEVAQAGDVTEGLVSRIRRAPRRP
jgi:hypothetical protein